MEKKYSVKIIDTNDILILQNIRLPFEWIARGGDGLVVAFGKKPVYDSESKYWNKQDGDYIENVLIGINENMLSWLQGDLTINIDEFLEQYNYGSTRKNPWGYLQNKEFNEIMAKRRNEEKQSNGENK